MAEAQNEWPGVARDALNRLPVGWLFVAFCVFIFAWAVRGVAKPYFDYRKEDRENERRYQLDQAKFNDAKNRRGRKKGAPTPVKRRPT